MKQPTKEQIQWFWERCGFVGDYLPLIDHSVDPPQMYAGHWCFLFPDGTSVRVGHLPPIDLNNLFKYAVPKMGYVNIQFSDQYSDVIPQFSATASIRFADNHIWADEDPALALFWAIYKALGGAQ